MNEADANGLPNDSVPEALPQIDTTNSDPRLPPINAERRARKGRQPASSNCIDGAPKSDSENLEYAESESGESIADSTIASSQEENVPQPQVDILYVVHLPDANRGEPQHFYTDRAFPGVDFALSETEQRTDSKEAILTVGASVVSKGLQEKKGNSASNWWKKPVDIDFGGQIQVEQTYGRYIRIVSKRLLGVLESVIDYSPSQWAFGLNFYTVNAQSCFTGLMLYYSELRTMYRKFAEALDDENAKCQALLAIDDGEQGSNATELDSAFGRVDDPIIKKPLDKEIATEVAVLLKLLKPHYHRHVIPILQKLRLTEPRVAFEHLWFIYKPGSLAYRIRGDQVVALIVVSAVEKGQLEGDQENQGKLYEVDAWYLEHAGRHLRRQNVVTKIDHFDGDRPVTSLSLIPASYYDVVDGGKVRHNLEARGKKSLGIIKEGYAYRSYQHPHSRSEGHIIVDPEKYNEKLAAYRRDRQTRYNPPLDNYGLEFEPTEADLGILSESLDYEEPLDGHGHRRFRRYHDIDTSDEKQLDKLLPHGILLLSPRIGGVSLSSKRWVRFRVDGISETPPWKQEKQLEECLVLDDPHDKEILRTVLLKEHGQSSLQADFVSRKGEGRVFLLYGPPGSGKTLTAECVANDTRRPLISLSPYDVGASSPFPGESEYKLQTWFVLAAKWGAILLIDEADIFLEKRQAGGLGVNSTTTVFLRTMEYYAGILFLTTNRPGKIDDSFISRVTPIRYPEVTSDVRNQIWDKFFDMYKKFHKIEVLPKARKILRNDPTRLNGREVRNVFRNAISIAKLEVQDEEQSGSGFSTNGCSHDEQLNCNCRPAKLYVSENHFSKALERHKDFKDYMNQLNRNIDEPTRNRMTGNY